jgi:hypothetical protein
VRCGKVKAGGSDRGWRIRSGCVMYSRRLVDGYQGSRVYLKGLLTVKRLFWLCCRAGVEVDRRRSSVCLWHHETRLHTVPGQKRWAAVGCGMFWRGIEMEKKSMEVEEKSRRRG